MGKNSLPSSGFLYEVAELYPRKRGKRTRRRWGGLLGVDPLN